MTKDELYSHPGWADCTFEGARRHVLRMGLKTTFREKLEAIEQAGRLAEKFRQNCDSQPRIQPSC